MHSLTCKSTLLGAVAVATLLSSPGQAADTEVFFATIGESTAQPNVLFILDTSKSMDAVVSTLAPYSAEVLYEDVTGCDTDKIYWTDSSSGVVPEKCDGLPYVALESFRCESALEVLRTSGVRVEASVAEYNLSTLQWQRLQTTTTDLTVECQADGGNGPDGRGTGDYRASNGSPNGYAVTVASGPGPKEIKWNSLSNAYGFFTGNYLNWANQPTSPNATATRLEVMRDTLYNVLSTTSGINVGFMRYATQGSGADGAGRGGMVIHEIVPLDDVSRESIRYTLYDRKACNPDYTGYTGTLDDCQPPLLDPPDLCDDGDGLCVPFLVAEGQTPISESMWEAYRYYAGLSVDFGAQSKLNENVPLPSVEESLLNPGAGGSNLLYKSPITESCQTNFIVVLSDGSSEQDGSRNTAITRLPGFTQLSAPENKERKCDPEFAANDDAAPSNCIDDFAEWLSANDISPNLPGVQNVKTYTIGFDLDASGVEIEEKATRMLQETAARSQGEFFEADDAIQLSFALTEILRQVLIANASFSSPSVTVNAFNRTQNLNELYLAMFRPEETYHWAGNLKKYVLTSTGVIVDGDGSPAVDASTGFFATTARSIWSTAVDGADVTLGGAASKLNDPGNRKLYTNLAEISGAFFPTTGALTLLKDLESKAGIGAVLGLGALTSPSVKQLIAFHHGFDVRDQDGDGDTAEPRFEMGDPLHGRPSIVIYGGTVSAPDVNDALVFMLTNDGFLHAIDPANGEELWAFVPSDLLARLYRLYEDAPQDPEAREYGLDGDIQVLRIDRNQNGIIESSLGDRVYLYFGMRRGGYKYFALNVTRKTAPTLEWVLGPSQLPGIGQSWSPPSVARVAISGKTQNANKFVLVFGGGYAPNQDLDVYSTDGSGNRLFMIDAISGSLLWSAGSSGANLNLPKMTHSIPSAVRPLDLTGDGLADRMYAADLGGRVWRFDIANGQTADNLVTGGVFASLGIGDSGGTPIEENRRFFYAPDVSLLTLDGRRWLNVAIGSGHRERPASDKITNDRFYSLRDYSVYAKLDNSAYQDSCLSSSTTPCHQIITDGDTRLIDITNDPSPTLPAGSVGWKLDLVEDGEKVLAESRTFQNALFFPSYTPRQKASTDACAVNFGVNKLYIISAFDASPINNFDGMADVVSVDDRYQELAQASIAPEVVFVFPSPDDPTSCSGPDCAPPPVCLVGLESCGSGLTTQPVRTYWRQEGTP